MANSRGNIAPKSDKYWEGVPKPSAPALPNETGGLASNNGLPKELFGLV